MSATKPLIEMTALEVLAELRTIPRDELGAWYVNDPGDEPAGALLTTRAQLRIYRSLRYAVMIGSDRDLPRLTSEWDQLSRRFVRAVNGRPEGLREANATLLLARDAVGIFQWDACSHEAAHAVAAHHLGAVVDLMSVLRGDRGPVCVTQDAHLSATDRVKIRIAARELAALEGDLREHPYLGDIRQGRELASDAAIEAVRHETRALLVEHIAEVIVVARALSKRSRLEGDELRQIIEAEQAPRRASARRRTASERTRSPTNPAQRAAPRGGPQPAPRPRRDRARGRHAAPKLTLPKKGRTVFTITLSGPASSASAARAALDAAGHEPASPMSLDVAEGEQLLGCLADDADTPTSVVESLGWRHRATMAAVGPALALTPAPFPLDTAAIGRDC